MNKPQFVALNVVGGVCALLIAGNIALGTLNSRLNVKVMQTQGEFTRAQQMHTMAQNLVVRIAQAGRTEPVLRSLLERHDFNVAVGTNSPPAQAP
jgi:hypothetical protein